MEFRRVLAALPPETLVPVGWVLENIGHDPEPVVDYTLQEVAEMTGRAVGTVRSWCNSGQLRAYKLMGREWRVPVGAWEEFQEGQREKRVRRPNQPEDVDLGAWRKVRGVEKRRR